MGGDPDSKPQHPSVFSALVRNPLRESKSGVRVSGCRGGLTPRSAGEIPCRSGSGRQTTLDSMDVKLPKAGETADSGTGLPRCWSGWGHRCRGSDPSRTGRKRPSRRFGVRWQAWDGGGTRQEGIRFPWVPRLIPVEDGAPVGRQLSQRPPAVPVRPDGASPGGGFRRRRGGARGDPHRMVPEAASPHVRRWPATWASD